jgi:hypothetical protein
MLSKTVRKKAKEEPQKYQNCYCPYPCKLCFSQRMKDKLLLSKSLPRRKKRKKERTKQVEN